MAIEGRRSLGGGGSNGDISSQIPQEFGKRNSTDEGKPSRFTAIIRILTVLAYIVSVSTAAALLSAYYVFLWVPQPSAPLNRPTEPPHSLAQRGNSHFAGGSYYHYPKNTYSNAMDASKHLPPVRNKKSHYKTTPSPYLPKPQYLIRRKATARPYSTPPGA